MIAFLNFKLPCLACKCLSILTEEMLEVTINKEILDQLFDILFDKQTSTMYTLCSYIINRQLGNFCCLFEGLIKSIPTTLFAYLRDQRDSLIPRLINHIHRYSIFEVFRFFLDIPLNGTLDFFDWYIDYQEPWWQDSEAFVDSIIHAFTSETNEEAVYLIGLFLQSIVQRGCTRE